MEPFRNRGCAACGWKRSQGLVSIMSFMVMSLVFMLAWEGTRPLLLVFTPDTKISTVNWYFGGSEQTKAIWASNEQVEGGVQRMVERKWKLSTRLDQPENSVEGKIYEEVSTDGTLGGDPGEKPVDVSSSWEFSVPDNLVDSSSRSRIGAIQEEGDNTARSNPSLLNNDNNNLADDRPSSTGRDVESDVSLHVEVMDVSSTTEFTENDSNIRIDIANNSNAEKALQTTNSTKSPTDSVTSSGVCDFTRGYWVKDESRPLYDGRKCKGYLAGMWACREMNRPDFEYEKLRWQPDGCDLPAFTSHGFLDRMKNKVIAFVGDSLGRQQFQSLMCMLTEGEGEVENVDDAGEEWGFTPVHPSLRGKGYANKFTRTNTTVMFYWSATLTLIEPNRPDEEEGWRAMHLDRPDVFLQNDIQKLDLLILNSGHHWNRAKFDGNKWHTYADGKRVTGRKLSGIGESYNLSMYKVVEYLDAKLAETGGKPTVFMRTLSPRHFKNGDWNTGGSCDNTRPEYGQKVTAYKGPTTETVIHNSVLKSDRVRLLNIVPPSSTREEAHISKYGRGKDSGHQDCLHWCLPGVPDTWNELLYGYLASDSSLATVTGHQGDKMQ